MRADSIFAAIAVTAGHGTSARVKTIKAIKTT
jgi:hypothetical protein